MPELTRSQIEALKICVEVADPRDPDDSWEQQQVNIAREAIHILDRCNAVMGDSRCQRAYGHDGLHIDHGRPYMTWAGTTRTHGSNQDCPDVRSGKWKFCQGHTIG